jgi:hypothetical protein
MSGGHGAPWKLLALVAPLLGPQGAEGETIPHSPSNENLRQNLNSTIGLFTVTRDFVRSCQTPILVLPDDVPGHPDAVAMETVRLAPHAEATVYPWKEPQDLHAKTVQHVHDFLRAHTPATAAR